VSIDPSNQGENRKMKTAKFKIKNSKFKISRPPITYHLSPGFTLIELMVVVVIMAVLVIASLPTLREFSHGRRLQAGRDTVIAALRKARTETITKRKRYKTVIDINKQAVAIFDNDNNLVGNWEKLPDFVSFDDSSSALDDLESGLGSPFYYLEFEPDGSLTSDASPAIKEIYFKGKSTQDTVGVHYLTGRIE